MERSKYLARCTSRERYKDKYRSRELPPAAVPWARRKSDYRRAREQKVEFTRLIERRGDFLQKERKEGGNGADWKLLICKTDFCKAELMGIKNGWVNKRWSS